MIQVFIISFSFTLSKQRLVYSNTTHWHNTWRWCTTNKTSLPEIQYNHSCT